MSARMLIVSTVLVLAACAFTTRATTVANYEATSAAPTMSPTAAAAPRCDVGAIEMDGDVISFYPFGTL